MSALAGFLREQALADMREMSAIERIRLALTLGDDDVRILCAAAGVDVAEAHRRISAARQIGRRFSTSASKP